MCCLTLFNLAFQQMSLMDRMYRTPGHNIIRFGRTSGHNIFRFGKKSEPYKIDKNLEPIYSYNFEKDQSDSDRQSRSIGDQLESL